MIPAIHLDEDSFQDIFEKARKRIPVIFPQWTNFNTNDSGIALLELFSWLTEIQEYHMDQIGEEHLKTYLEILGITPEKKTPSCGFVRCFDLKENQILKAGSLFLAGQVPFESLREEFLFQGRACEYRVYTEKGTCIHTGEMDSSSFVPLHIPVFGRYPSIGSLFEIKLDAPLASFQEHGFYLDIKEDYEIRRNPIGDSGFIPIVKLGYEYETKTGWKPLKVIRDNTIGMIKSGIITLLFQGKTGEEGLCRDNGYHIRIRLLEGEYDVYPILEYFYENPVEVIQWETIVRNGERQRLGKGNGFPNQAFFLQADHILGESVEIQVENVLHAKEMEPWTRVGDFSRSGPEDKHFTVDEAAGQIRFGDGYHGMAPEGFIELTSLKKTLGAEGNVKKGQLHFAKGKASCGFTGLNPASTWGGADGESLEDSLKRLNSEIQKIQYAVTSEDYENRIKAVPGLMIQNVKAVEGKEDNSVYVVVKPFRSGQQEELSAEYRKNIMDYLEQVRIIGTRIQLFSPDLIEISLYMNLELYSYFQGIEEIIKKKIAAYFKENQDEFGKPVIYSTVYGFIESIENVKRIHTLTIETQGQRITRNTNQDVMIPFQGIIMLTDIECNVALSE